MARRRRIGLIVGLFVLGILLASMTLWGALALHYSDLANPILRHGLTGAFSLAGLAAIIALFLRHLRWKATFAHLALFAVLLAWWWGIEPSNDRDWQPDMARLAHADIQGNLITVRNIRNFDYRTETDFTPAYYDKTFDLDKLESVDLVAVYWMGPAIAHTILSFGFSGGDQLAISIETRKEKGEGYSTIKGFFKQFELYYVVADERDVIRVRSNYRKDPPEDVYVYRVHGNIDNARRLFLEYMRRINGLKEKPEFYNTLTDNCTTGIWMNTRINPGHLPLSWKLLASGYVPAYLYETGRLNGSKTFAELQQKSHINARAQAADQAPDFSRRIRDEVPGHPGGR
jgi:hypothetical protein